jgi:arsenate reductase
MKKNAAVEVWGIPTCGTVKKALAFLTVQGVPYEFKNFRTTNPPKALLVSALDVVASPKKIFNTSGASYREGGWGAKAAAMSPEQIVDALLADPMLIKRPIIRTSKGFAVGFNEEVLLRLL